MRKGTFDFNEIVDLAHFFQQFSERFNQPETIYDLNELWDVVFSPDMPHPVEVEFVHLGSGQKRRYDSLILLFKQAEEKLKGHFRFNLR